MTARADPTPHAFAGQRADTSYLDPIKVEDAPAEAIRLAAAELALRVQEERRRRQAGLQANPNLQTQRMTGKPSERCIHSFGSALMLSAVL